ESGGRGTSGGGCVDGHGGGFVGGVPAAAGGGEEDVLKRVAGLAEGAHAEAFVAAEGGPEGFARIAGGGGEHEGAVAVGVGVAGFLDVEAGVDRGEDFAERGGVAGDFELVAVGPEEFLTQ